MKKTFCLILAISLVLVVVGGVMGYDFNDVTKVQEWRGTAPYGSGNWTDVIGDANYFNTFGANLSGNTFTIFTNWNPSKDGYLYVETADFFIDSGSDGTFDYAIRLTNRYSNLGAVYINPTYQSSQDFYSSRTGYIYGGLYDQASPSKVPVQATSNPGGSTSVTWTYGSNGINNQVVIDLTGLSLSNWSFVWGTGTCSNDALAGSAPVPEPATMFLLGTGLLGLAGLGRKLRKK